MPRGSSPLARGLLAQVNDSLEVRRIIPARAGFTGCCATGTGCTRDHPRSRGVYLGVPDLDRGAAGSSPLARGLPSRGPMQIDAGRIIPARAGFTQCCSCHVPFVRDHPRSRGVYPVLESALPPALGSSPLARGLRFVDGEAAAAAGIIPARAGFTSVAGRSVLAAGDHPRSRGVYPYEPCSGGRLGGSLEDHLLGSSPLARGLHGWRDS